MKKITGLVHLSICLCALLLSTHARAQAAQYQVEMIAFARSASTGDESWNRLYDLRYPPRSVTLQPADGSGAPYQLLPDTAMQLNQAAAAIDHRHNMRVLLHVAWRQAVDAPAQAIAVALSGGRAFGLHRELEGTFTLSFVDPYLRADTDLWLSEFSTDTAAASGQLLPTPPGELAPPAADAMSTTGSQTPASAQQYVVTQTAVMQQRRRLRSGELHYFDHPLFGLVVLVTPVAAPADTTTTTAPTPATAESH